MPSSPHENNKKAEDPLGQWYLYACSVSSEFSIKQRIFKRGDVNKTYNILNDFLGDSIKKKVRVDTKLNKINWLRSFLFSDDHLSTQYLIHIATLINFAQYKTSDKTFKDLKSNLQQITTFRSYLFEILTYKLLFENKIAYRESFIENGKQKEGTLSINGIEYLFECRKLFLPEYDNVINKLHIQTILLENLSNSKNYVFPNGFIIQVLNVEHKTPEPHIVNQIIKSNIKKHLRHELQNPITLKHEKFTIKIEKYNYARLIELEHDENKNILIAASKPEMAYTPFEFGYAYKLKGLVNFSIHSEKFNDYVKDIVNEKLKQHAQSQFKNQVIFLDLEIIKEIEKPPFNSINDFLENTSLFEALKKKVTTFYQETGHELIICFIVRDLLIYPISSQTVVVARENNTTNEKLGSMKVFHF